MSVRAAINRIARVGLHQCGGLPALVWRSRQRFRILTYHRFSSSLYPGSADALAKQFAYLKRSYNAVSLTQISESLRTGKSLPPRALAVTIDDGYRDFLEDAFPVFRAWNMPVTVFLITDFIDGKLWPWWNQVAYAADNAPAGVYRIAISREEGAKEYSLETRDQRVKATADICADVIKAPNRGRIEFLRNLPELFRVDIPQRAPRESAALTWDEVRFLAGNGVEFGAHTKTHPILPRVEEEAEVCEEIEGSRQRIEQELGRAPLHFCYPNGDFDSRALRIVERCGFEAAVTTEPGLNAASQNPYRLKRISAEPGLPEHYFREEVAGLHV